MNHRKGYIPRSELLEAALNDAAFRARYEQSSLPFAKLLSSMRAHAGLTQEALAKLSGFGRPLVSMLESGTLSNTRWNTMAELAKACGYRLILSAEEVKANESQ